MDGILDSVKCSHICFCLLYTFPVKKKILMRQMTKIKIMDHSIQNPFLDNL